MAYSTEEGYYTVGDLGQPVPIAGETFLQKYKWYLLGAAALAAAGAGYYFMKKGGAGAVSDIADIDDVGCGCD